MLSKEAENKDSSINRKDSNSISKPSDLAPNLSQTLFDLAPMLVVVLDKKGRVKKINQRGCDILGYSQAEIIDKIWFDHFIPESFRVEVRSVFTDIITGKMKGLERYQNPLLTKDGRMLNMAWHNAYLYDEDGNIASVLSMGTDITEQQLMQDIISTSTAVAFVWQNRPGWPVEYVSANVRNLFGYDSQEFTSGSLLYEQIIHPDDLPKVKNEVHYYSDRKSASTFIHKRYRIITKDGQIKWVVDRTYIKRNTTGEVLGYQGIIVDISEIVHREQQIINKEKYYRSILTHMHEDIFVIDREYNIVDINKHHLKTLDYSYDEVIGHKCYEISHRLDKPCHQMGEVCALQHVFETGRSQNVQHVHRQKDGSAVHVDILFSPLKTEEGEVTHVIKAMRDVSDLMAAHVQLQSSEERYRNLFNESPIGLLEADLSFWIELITQLRNQGINDLPEYFRKNPKEWIKVAEGIRLINMNTAAIQIVQANSKQEVAEHLTTIYDIKTSPALQEALLSISERQRSGEYDLKIYTLQKAERYVHLKWNVLAGHEDTYDRVFISASDITAQRLAENQMRILSISLEQSPLSVILTNPEGEIQYVNPKFCEITGYSVKEVIGKNPHILKSDEHPAEFYKELWDTISGGSVWHGEFHNRKKNGELFWEEATISPVFDESGRIIYYIAKKVDITARKQLSEQLHQAQKMESIGRLAGGIAHDFNNLLTIINGYSSLALAKLQKDDELSRQIRQIAQAGWRAGELTQQLLAFSRKQVIQPKIMDLNLHLRNMEKMLKRLIGEDIQLELKLENNLGLIKADSGQIDQIILNLIVNARDAMPHGGKLLIETANFQMNGDYAVSQLNVKKGRYTLLVITDNGIGMDKKILSKIFEPFFTTKEQGKGTGLGLSTVYGIVKQSHGYIWAYSELNVGTTFKIYLPQVIHDDGRATISKSIKEENLQGTETILIVEDENSVRQLAVEILEQNGYNLIPAENGVQCLELIAEYKRPIHLLLTDVIMPQMGGKEVAEQVQTLLPNIKTIFISGYTDEAITRYGVLPKGVIFLQKPFEPQSLLQIVRQTLDEKN